MPTEQPKPTKPTKPTMRIYGDYGHRVSPFRYVECEKIITTPSGFVLAAHGYEEVGWNASEWSTGRVVARCWHEPEAALDAATKIMEADPEASRRQITSRLKETGVVNEEPAK